MPFHRSQSFRRLRDGLARVFRMPLVLPVLPALSLGAYWIAGERGLFAISAILPLGYLVARDHGSQRKVKRDRTGGILARRTFETLVDDRFLDAWEEGLDSAIFCIGIEELDALTEKHGPAAADCITRRSGERLMAISRTLDVVGRIGASRYAVALAPVRCLDLETCIQMATRLQEALEEPVSVDGIGIYPSASVGFCQLSRCRGNSGEDWMRAAQTALREAMRHGPSAIRAFSEQMHLESRARTPLRDEVVEALEMGQIQPWFQPQISTDTGLISGFEALARWHHPIRGLIPPSEFLPTIEDAGLLERLAEVVMYQSFSALKAWDSAGLEVPQIGVNFAGSELNNPRLLEKIKWELDRFDLSPDRLAVEVLETVVASAPDDVVTRNITALGKLGCHIDLDDFGTGHASIAAIRRFSVSRIKIDRSFVIKADRDPEQQRMISAILTMAERLELKTLAEGVETVGEHVLLAQLGCDHVQGFGIARPMPFDQTADWIRRHNAKLADVPRLLDRRQG